MNNHKKVIAVDDNLTNLSVLKNVLKPYYETYTVSSAEKMFDLLQKVKADIILLDVEMPDLSGYEAIRILKNNLAYKDIPVIFLTALNEEQDEMKGLDLGAVDYICKPFVAPLLLRRIETHLSLAEHKRELQELNESIQKKYLNKAGEVTELQNAILDIIAGMVEDRDEDTGGHIHRIKRYLSCLIDALTEMDIYSEDVLSFDMEFLLPSSQLHDLGKIAISDVILNKPGKLTDEEYEIMKTHAQIGVDAIVKMEKITKDSGFLEYAKIFAGTHHERWDGSGYPNGLRGTDIPLIGRLMAIADVYDALVSARPYKEAYSCEKAISIIREGSGTQFDPLLIDTLDKISDQFAYIAGHSETVSYPVAC